MKALFLPFFALLPFLGVGQVPQTTLVATNLHITSSGKTLVNQPHRNPFKISLTPRDLVVISGQKLTSYQVTSLHKRKTTQYFTLRNGGSGSLNTHPSQFLLTLPQEGMQWKVVGGKVYED